MPRRCFVVARLNRRIAAAKIQARETPPAQIRRDQRQSLVSLAGDRGDVRHRALALCRIRLGLRAAARVAGSMLAFLGSLVLFDTWFYWFHRLIHTPAAVRLGASLAPPDRDPGRLVEQQRPAGRQSVPAILLAGGAFLIPAAPAVLLAHKLYDQVTGVIGHSGWEHGGSWCRPPSPLVGVTHHDQHHRYFRCNYATHFTLWDRLMGTLHPEHDAELRRNIAATAAVRRTARRAGGVKPPQSRIWSTWPFGPVPEIVVPPIECCEASATGLPSGVRRRVDQRPQLGFEDFRSCTARPLVNEKRAASGPGT